MKILINKTDQPFYSVVPQEFYDAYNITSIDKLCLSRKDPRLIKWLEDHPKQQHHAIRVEEIPVTVVEVIKKCDCGGEFEYTPGMTQTLEYPPHYTHTCNKCGKVERFLRTYPYQKYKRI